MFDRRDRGAPGRRRRPHLAALVGSLVLTLAVAACAGGHGAGGVASLNGGNQPTASTSAGLDPKQAALAFSRCMREHGVDMPDPKFSSNGAITLDAGPGAVGPDNPKFKAAQQACKQYQPGGGQARRPDPRMVQQALKFARCMRQHGIDMPDPSSSGGIVVGNGSGNVGNGPRPDDPKFKAAQEACKQYLPKGGSLQTSSGGGQ